MHDNGMFDAEGATISAAVVQAAPVSFDIDATLTRVDDLLTRAASDGADLVVFPEAFVSAYPRGMTFGATVGQRTPEGRRWFQRYWESSVDVPGPVTERIGKAAARHGTHVVIGVIERAGGTLYCTVLTFSPRGELLAKHRKLMPTGTERLVWGFGDGSTMAVTPTPIGRIGSVICWENYMPLLRTHMYAQGVQLYCAPTADPRDSWVASMRHIAAEGRCFVLAANQFTRGCDYPADYPLDVGSDEILSRGNSVIVSPLGEVLAGPTVDAEAILHARLDLGEITRGKFDFDVVGHYARPDVFQLSVDTERRDPVTTNRLPAAEHERSGPQPGPDWS